MKFFIGFVLLTMVSNSSLAQEAVSTPAAVPSSAAEESSKPRGPNSLTWSIEGIVPENERLKISGSTEKERINDTKISVSYGHNIGYLEPRVSLLYEDKTDNDQTDNTLETIKTFSLYVGSDFNFIKNERPNDLIPFANISLGYVDFKEDNDSNTSQLSLDGHSIALKALLGLKWFPLHQDFFAVVADVSWSTSLNATFDVSGTSSGSPVDLSGDANIDQTGYEISFAFYF